MIRFDGWTKVVEIRGVILLYKLRIQLTIFEPENTQKALWDKQKNILSNILRECKGYACDIDHIGFLDDELIIIESKSKDPANKKLKRDKTFNESSNWYFGWDWRRFAHYMELYYNTGINTVYLIEELDNQKDRNVVGYKYLQLSEILKQSSWGEGGDTNNIPYDAFIDFGKL